jgi:hypothetical protein
MILIAPAARRNSLFLQIFENFVPAAAPRRRYDTRANGDIPHFRAGGSGGDGRSPPTSVTRSYLIPVTVLPAGPRLVSSGCIDFFG